MMASICILSWNRTEIAKKSIEHNLRTANFNHHDHELLICDQGTQDETYIEWLKSLNPTYLRLNKFNEGVARSLNQLIVRAKSDNIWLLPADVIMPDNWLELSLSYANDLARLNLGILNIRGENGPTMPEGIMVGDTGKVYEFATAVKYLGENKRPTDDMNVYGPILITRRLVNEIGGYCESYHPYGLEDADLCFRAHIAGMLVGYIPGLTHTHIDSMSDATTDDPDAWNYKARKEYAHASNIGLHRWRAEHYGQIGIYEPLPIQRDPLT